MNETSNIPRELEKAIDENRVIFGLKQTLRVLKGNKEAEAIFYANNIPENVKEEVEKYAKLRSVSLVKFEGNGKEFGIALKRGHSIMILTIIKKE